MAKDPFREADKSVTCPKCGEAFSYNVGPGEPLLKDITCHCGYRFKSSDGRRGKPKELEPPTPWAPKPSDGVVIVASEVQVWDAHDGRRRRVRVEAEQGGVALNVRGFGNAGVDPGYGPVVLLEFRNGIPFVVVWADITSEDYTHCIDLSGASENLRPD